MVHYLGVSATPVAPPESPERFAALEAVRTLGRLVTVFAERRKQLAESVGLTDQQWQALEEVHEEHFMPTLFAQKRETSAAAVSKILRQLTDKGLILPRVAKHDGRQRAYALTEHGAALLEQLRKEREAVITSVWMGYPRTTLAEFSAFGNDLATRLEALVELRKSARRGKAGTPEEGKK
jgi:DNA-binding MarR family transcriptional regulator